MDEDDSGPYVPVRFTDEAIDAAIKTYQDIGGDETGEDVQLTVTIEGDVQKYETYAISSELASAIYEGDWDGEFLIHTDSEGDARTLRSGLKGGESSGDSNTSSVGDGNDSGEIESFYELQINAPEESPGEKGSCKFEELPEGAQKEFENAIKEADFETEDRIMYRLEDSPVMLDTDCYGQYIIFEGEYYEVNVIAAGG